MSVTTMCPECGGLATHRGHCSRDWTSEKRHPKAGAPSTLAYGQRCIEDGCLLDAWCSFCGGSCILHCAGRTSRWEALKYFWRAWRAYVSARF